MVKGAIGEKLLPAQFLELFASILHMPLSPVAIEINYRSEVDYFWVIHLMIVLYFSERRDRPFVVLLYYV
jgi:hypothetical protein